VEDPRRYMRMMEFVRARIEDGTFKPDELMPSIQQLSGQTGFSRHTIGKAMRLLQDEGLVYRTPGLGYCAKASAATAGGGPHPVGAANGHHCSRVGWGLGGAAHGHR
jgi:DNA-binding GntR family transcriptional regulator